MDFVKSLPDWLDDGPDGTLRVTVGVDLGQLRDPTAIVVAEAERRPTGAIKEHRGRSGLWQVPIHDTYFLVRHVERMPLRTSFRSVGRRLRQIVDGLDVIAGPDREFNPFILADRTGYGLPAVEYLREELGTRVPTSGVIITVGEQLVGRLGAWEVRAPKAHLVTRLAALLQAGLIELPASPEAHLLADELKAFQVHQYARGIKAEAEPGASDDLTVALALAVLFDPHANRIRRVPSPVF